MRDRNDDVDQILFTSTDNLQVRVVCYYTIDTNGIKQQTNCWQFFVMIEQKEEKSSG